MQTKQWIPWTMVLGRAILGPVVILGECCRWNAFVLAAIVFAALLSDIFDGVLARRWKTDTAALRLSDSLADTVFYVCVAIAVAVGMPAVWHQCRSSVLIVLGCEAARFAFDLIKFGKPASYHSYLAKTWGLVLAPAVIVAFATQHISLWMGAAVVLGVLSNAETMAMSIMLPVWRRDVKTLKLAWQIRKDLLRERLQIRSGKGIAVGLAVVLGVALLGGQSMQAQGMQKVTYVGGTTLKGVDLQGKLSISSPDELVFQGPSKLTIPYDHVISYESTSRARVPVGLLTEGLWRLIAPWPEAKQLSLSYRDTDDHAQVIVLEMSRADEALLVEVLKTRVPRSAAPPVMLSVRPPVIGHEKTAMH